MLVSTIDRAIDGDVPIDVAGSVGQDLGQYSVPGALGGVSSVSFPHRWPGAEVFSRKVAPGDSGPVPIDDTHDDSAVVREWTGSLARAGGQKRFDVPIGRQ